MNQINKADILEKISEADMVLLGIGKELEYHAAQSSARILEVYNKIEEILHGKNYFILTTNTDDLIYESSFIEDRIVAPCGSIHRFQCSEACTKQLWEEQLDKCPVCGVPMCPNTVKAEKYVEEGYLKQWGRYMKWLPGTLNKKLCVLEIGVLMDYPSVIRWPFEKTVFINEKAFLIRLNEHLPQLSAELKDRGLSVKCNPFAYFLE